MKKRSFIAMALVALFLSATVSVFAAGDTTSKDTNVTAPGGHLVGANDVTGTYVPD